ncbi:MAG: TspO/MBR family protein [Pseudomonadota bacterium]
MEISSLVSLAAFFAACFATAGSGAVFKPGPWYETLTKPPWTPPNWAFPVVWTILFTLMAVSGWLVWESAGAAAWTALTLYAVHLVINAVWSWLFFGKQRLDLAMVDVIVLWAMIAAMIIAFLPYSVLASVLLTPYLLWVTLAAGLNFRLLQMNGARGVQTT